MKNLNKNCSVIHRALILISLSSLSQAVSAHQSDRNEYLPPLEKWHGASEKLLVSGSNPWQTPAEKSNLRDTPSYKETFAYLDKLVASDSRLNKVSLGKSPQGRDVWMVIASNEGLQSPKTLKQQGKPILLVQAGIHSGEIDGKDAGLMLLRDIIHGPKADLLKNVNLLFVPILSVDAHERSSPFNRVNQRGPVQMGWRTNSQNLNLNRDYSKLDTPELQHLIKAINIWQPDLYFDVHVTDGEDYQYDITYGFNGEHGDSPNISRWLQNKLSPSVNKALSANGHMGGPLTFGMDSLDFQKGLQGWTASPRFSTGYGDVRHLATVLVENHSLKPYKQRVLGTYVLLEQTLKLLSKEGDSLKKATHKDQNKRELEQVVAWDLDKKNPEKMDYAGIEYSKQKDSLLELEYVKWLGKLKTYKDLPIFWERQPKTTVKIARNYWLPPQYLEIINRLEIHGIQFETIKQAQTINANQLTAYEVSFKEVPFEGHQQPTAEFTESHQTITLPKGSLRISSDQSLGNLVVALLDPRAPDSFFKWGFFNQMFQRTEYIESYAMIPLAKMMVSKDRLLEGEFLTKKKTDANFAKDPKAQMRWFYERSEYFDKSYLKYPVLLEY
jgi:hypothetical protein